MKISCDYLIIGAGIIGLAIARELMRQSPNTKVIIAEKESDVAKHASGRNSGVLHAGFYYTSDSLKAKFTVSGNKSMKEYCRRNSLKLNECGKVVVAKNKSELKGLLTLFERGTKNGVELRLIGQHELSEIEPNAKTYERALYSPTTATVSPIQVARSMRAELERSGVSFVFDDGFERRGDGNYVFLQSGKKIEPGHLINCSGLYADKIAREYGFSTHYEIIPFKGIYLKYKGTDRPINTNIYPVPNLENPFLGVHYTVTVDNEIKIGPTAIPAFWRENYSGFSNFSLTEAIDILAREAQLFLLNKFNFRSLAIEEVKKYHRPTFRDLALNLVKNINIEQFIEWSQPGIRAQLLDTRSMALVQDFIIEGDQWSTHVLNAVSPAFTCSIPFSKYVVDNFIIINK
jgi:(S)-2-hydroxyglutarate dehydrogenase